MMVKEICNIQNGDWIIYGGKRKICYGTHHNGNILIKMNGRIVQVPKLNINL